MSYLFSLFIVFVKLSGISSHQCLLTLGILLGVWLCVLVGGLYGRWLTGVQSDCSLTVKQAPGASSSFQVWRHLYMFMVIYLASGIHCFFSFSNLQCVKTVMVIRQHQNAFVLGQVKLFRMLQLVVVICS